MQRAIDSFCDLLARCTAINQCYLETAPSSLPWNKQATEKHSRLALNKRRLSTVFVSLPILLKSKGTTEFTELERQFSM